MGFTRRKEVINGSTGEILITENVVFKKGEEQRRFVKMFLKDMHLLRGLRAGAYQITFEMLYRMNYDNEVIVHQEFRRNLSEILGLSVGYIDHTMKDLMDKKIIARKARGLYIMNPYIFGKGDWHNVQEVRMKTNYDKNGKTEEYKLLRDGDNT